MATPLSGMEFKGGDYSRGAIIRGGATIQGNTVCTMITLFFGNDLECTLILNNLYYEIY